MEKEKIKKIVPKITDEQLAALCAEIESDAENIQKTAEQGVKEAEINRLLKASGAKNIPAVRAILKTDSLKLTEDGITGFEQELEKVKKENGYLFSDGGKKPEFTAPPSKTAGITPEEFSGMSYKKRLKLWTENPQLYKELIG